MDLLVLISYRAIRPSFPADAKICATYLFHVTDVMYEPSCGFLELGFNISGEEISLATSRISREVEP